MISTTLSPLVEKLSNFLSAHPDHPVLAVIGAALLLIR